MSNRFIVELKNGTWLGRKEYSYALTWTKKNASTFKNIKDALAALEKAREDSPWKDAKIESIEGSKDE